MHERVASGLTIRAPRNEDVSSIAALLASVEIVLDGRAESTKEDVRFFWSWPGFEVERDAWIVEAEGSFVGYAWVWGPRLPQPDYDARLSLRLPDFPTDAAHLLLDQMEDRVVEKSRADDAGTLPRLAIPCTAADLGKRDLLEARGYRPVRTFFRMQRALEGTSERAAWPAETSVGTIRDRADEEDLYRVLIDSFAEHYGYMPEPFDEWRRRNLDHSEYAPTLSFVVRRGGEAVAGSLNYRSPDEGTVGMIGVRRPWRRLGLGRALLLHSFDAFRSAGLLVAKLGVDSENADRAVALYESVGMSVTRRNTLYGRTLETS